MFRLIAFLNKFSQLKKMPYSIPVLLIAVVFLSLPAHAQLSLKQSNVVIDPVVYRTAKLPSLNSSCNALKPMLVIKANPVYQETINKSVGAEQLTAEAEADWEPYVDKIRTLNLGYTEVEYEILYSFASEVAENDAATVSCAVPGVKLSIGFKQIEIKIAREIEVGSCLENEVLQHERQHVALYKKSLSLAVAKIENNFKDKLTDKVFLSDTAEAALTEANLYLEKFVYEDALKELESIRALHSSIDTPQEYARMSSVCGGAALKLTKVDLRQESKK